MTKPYLVFMAGSNSLIDVQEMVGPIKNYIRGINCLLHDLDEFSEEAKYILKVNNELGAGNVIFEPFVNRHDNSRNQILFKTGMQNGEWMIISDLLERPAAEFVSQAPDIIQANPSISAYYFYGKPLLIKFTEYLKYEGNPHEALLGIEGQRVDLSSWQPNEKLIRENVRPLKRKDKFGWVIHYAKYYMYPASNQCLLGLDNNLDRERIFHERQKNREEFLQHLKDSCGERTIESVLKIWENGLSNKMKRFISKEKILSDLYRLKILGDESVIDNHDLSDTIKFE